MAPQRKDPRLTKTKYLSARQCHKRVWYEIWRPHVLAPPTLSQRRIMDQGTDVGELARLRFAHGVLISSFGPKSLADTDAALAQGATCLFEPAFLYDNILVRCDVLLQRADGAWEIIEVKSSTQVKLYHVDDLSIQRYVVQGCGLTVAAVKLMHINSRDCVYPDLSNFFAVADVTAEVETVTQQLAANLTAIRAMLKRKQEPPVGIGLHCDHPFGCPLKRLCWRNVPAESIFTIPRLREDKVAELVARNILHICDVPADFDLTPAQRAYVEMVQRGQAEISAEGIRALLEQLERPIHFLDFETMAYALPRFEGMRPYQAAPFQYSCHVLHRNGRLGHREYLHADESDPRPAVARELLKHIGATGSVVAFNAGFERMVLLQLAEAVPEAADSLRSIAARLWDQRDIFRLYYAHPGFLGSTSIKRVLPVVVPGLSYADLAIQHGDDAQVIWSQMIACQDDAAKAKMAADLRDYCQLDTYAMVEIQRALEKVAAGASGAWRFPRCVVVCEHPISTLCRRHVDE